MQQQQLNNSTRLNYDTCTYRHNLKRSVGPGDYVFDTPGSHCVNCLPDDPRMRSTRSGVTLHGNPGVVDVSSELQGLTRPATNCPDGLYTPSAHGCCDVLYVPPACSDDRRMIAEDTRISNPPCTLRGTGWNRWEWLCQNPQARIEVPFDVQVNNRLVAKDNHRPSLPTPIDPALALPPRASMITAADDQEMRVDVACSAPQLNYPVVHWRECEDMRRS